MNEFESLRAITRRHFFDDYRSPLTCVAVPEASGSGGISTIDIEIAPVLRGPAPGPLSVSVNGGEVSLSWPDQPGSFAYVVYRATSEAGPFSILVSGVIATSWVDIPAIPGTFWYRLTAIEPRFGETEVSNTVSATV